jgi:hypothetical protein
MVVRTADAILRRGGYQSHPWDYVRGACPVSTPGELDGPAVLIMLLVESDKCRGLGRSPNKHRSTLNLDKPEMGESWGGRW